MKRIFLFLAAAGTTLSALAQAPSSKNMSGDYASDKDMQPWVLDVNLLGGGLTQDYTTKNTAGNYLNSVNVNTGGDLKFATSRSLGFDAQLGYFFGASHHFGIGAGFMYLAQQGTLSMANNYHVEYQATDFQNNVYRQVVTSDQPIQEKLQITNMN